MKFSAEWVRELSGVREPAEALARALTRVGLAVDAVEGEGDEAVLDVDVPSNRPDCLGHGGLARESAAAFGSRATAAAPAPASGPPAAAGAASPLRVEIEDPALCARYSAVVVRGVRVGGAPDWIRRRLERSGLRPRNVIVDITNYVMLETGQPLHAFDLARLRGGRLAVRRARAGESIVTLDAAPRSLAAGHLVITDGEGPVAVAGVMGGLDCEIRDSTRDVVIESARFDPPSVRRTARGLGMRTDGSQRFERGTDPEGTLDAALGAAALMARHASGRVEGPPVDLYPGRREPRRVPLRLARLRDLLGLEVEAGTARAILERLEFHILRADAERIEVEVPSFRMDVGAEEDLVEEVARHHGYDRIPATLPAPAPAPPTGGAGGLDRLPALLGALRAHGFTEAICPVFIAAAENALFADGDGAAVRLLNPLGGAQGEELRRSLLPGLVACVRRNLHRGARGVALYEVGVAFKGRPAGQPPEEEPRLALAAAGVPFPENWDRPPAPVDLFDLKGALEEGLARAGWPEPAASPASVEYLRAGRGARLACAGESLGSVGELHPDAARALDLDAGVVVAEVSLAALARVACAPPRLREIPRTPAVTRDLALVMPRRQPFAEVAEAIRSIDPRIVRVQPFDRYESERLGPERVGLALHVVYHHPERTLLTEEVQEIEDRILARLRERFGINLRGQ